MLTIDASELPRVMQCNGSLLLEPPFVMAQEDTTVRDEGTAAHYAAQMLFDGRMTADGLRDTKAPNGVFITSEMLQHVSDYIDELLVRHDTQEIGLMELPTSHGIPNVYQINGRTDHIVYYADTRVLRVNDFKYGYRLIEPDMNWTMISHAIGFVRARLPSWPLKIVFTIIQPRAPHSDGPVRSWTIDGAELEAYAQRLDYTLSNPSDILQTGPACGKCAALAICPAAHKMRMNALDTDMIAFNDQIDNERLNYELSLLTHAKKVIEDGLSARTELAKHRLQSGAVLKDYGIENQLTNRQWKPGITAPLLEAMTGRKLTEPGKLCTPAEAIRRGVPEETVAALAGRVSTGQKLVRIDHDKKARKAFGK